MNAENIEAGRTRHIDSALRKTRSCGISEFYETYMPDWQRLTANEAALMIKTLKEENVIVDKQWAALPTPTKVNGRWPKAEDAHFKGLETVFKRVRGVAERLFSQRFCQNTRTTKFMCRPRQTTDSEVNGSSHMVDAITVRRYSSYPKEAKESGSAHNSSVRLRRTGQVVYTADVLVSGEFKLGGDNKDRQDNDRKTFGHAGHAFYNDVGRVAVFSFTIEGNRMRLFCNTRSHTCISVAFKIDEVPEELVQFILFNYYASPVQLGLDPTVSRIVDTKGHLQYRFRIYNATKDTCVTYQTARVIDESSAVELYSRAMRVFEVYRVLDASPSTRHSLLADIPNVLRDYWVYDDVPNESEIQGAIRKRLEELNVWDSVKDHFMNIMEDGVVTAPPSEGSVRETVPGPHARAAPYQFVNPVDPSHTGASKSKISSAHRLRANGASGAGAPAKPARPPKPLHLHGKKHARTLYEQLCLDLYKVDDPAFFFWALSQIVTILRYMKLAGFLHRDGSPGNYLLHFLGLGKAPRSTAGTKREDWIAIMSDLEYARPYFGGTGHDPLTGTAYYVAGEVQDHKYHFYPMSIDAKRPDASPFFAFNFYHDLESVMWMALAFVIRSVSEKKLNDEVEGIPVTETLQNFAAEMFLPNIDGDGSRWQYIKDPEMTRKLGDFLKQIYHDSPIPELRELIFDLNRAYVALEASADTPGIQLNNGRKAYDPALFKDDVYDKFEAVFLRISNHFAGLPYIDTFVPVPDPPEPTYAPLSYSQDQDSTSSDEVDKGNETEEEGAEPLGSTDSDSDEECDEAEAEDATQTAEAIVATVRRKTVSGSKRKRDADVDPQPQAPAKRSRTKKQLLPPPPPQPQSQAPPKRSHAKKSKTPSPPPTRRSGRLLARKNTAEAAAAGAAEAARAGPSAPSGAPRARPRTTRASQPKKVGKPAARTR
ncbi:hypothetical protein BD626DRAFT_432263 [Schizophyllum amplum]|uniref:Fungal-type protein kinase domain-containing protein n=1 Tax=Schizophyllum amplum TaxID=97359 RepID=A0A550CDL5_9AGAR|nr:hypothetical protein BD626DRAFT_432263 [Auriculariopsis ampla]